MYGRSMERWRRAIVSPDEGASPEQRTERLGTTSPSSHFPTLPSRFRMVARLGAGGAGVVLKVFDQFLSADVALKFAAPGLASYLLREFEAFRQIRHANLVRVYDWLSLPDLEPFYTMEFMAGGDWSLGTGTPQDPASVRAI